MKTLMEMYNEGAITGYQLMLDCLHMLDPQNPDPVLSHLPPEVLEEMSAYARRYDPRRIDRSLLPPAEDQVRAAQRWLNQRNGSA